MFGFGGPELFIIVLLIGIPLGLCVMLARLKGLNGAWGLLSLVNSGVGFLVVGLIEPKPDRDTSKVRKLSIASIVVGSMLLVLKWASFALRTIGAGEAPDIITLVLTLVCIFVIFLGLPLFLGYKLARIKGLSAAWTMLCFVQFGVAFLVIGLMKPAPDHDTPKSKKLSIAAMVVGGVFVALQLIVYLLGILHAM